LLLEQQFIDFCLDATFYFFLTRKGRCKGVPFLAQFHTILELIKKSLTMLNADCPGMHFLCCYLSTGWFMLKFPKTKIMISV